MTHTIKRRFGYLTTALSILAASPAATCQSASGSVYPSYGDLLYGGDTSATANVTLLRSSGRIAMAGIDVRSTIRNFHGPLALGRARLNVGQSWSPGATATDAGGGSVEFNGMVVRTWTNPHELRSWQTWGSVRRGGVFLFYGFNSGTLTHVNGSITVESTHRSSPTFFMTGDLRAYTNIAGYTLGYDMFATVGARWETLEETYLSPMLQINYWIERERIAFSNSIFQHNGSRLWVEKMDFLFGAWLAGRGWLTRTSAASDFRYLIRM